MAPRVKLGSLDKMASSIRGQKASAGPKPTAGHSQSTAKKFAQDSSDSESSDETSSSGSGSDSDDDDLDAAKKKLDAKLASKKGSDSKVNGTKPQSQPARKPSKVAIKPESESESATGSDSESEDESESASAPSNKVAPKTHATAKSVDGSESETSSESEGSTSESDEEEQTGAKASTKKHKTAKTQNGRADESDSDESSGSSESDSDEQGDKDGNSKNTTVARVNGTAASSDSQLGRSNWLNSSDFTLRKASSENPGKEVSDFFSKTNLDGKQVWYFTAPSSLPITVIKEMEIDLAKATAGNPILNHQGDNYGLDLEANATNTQIQLLIPSKGGDKYNTLNRGIDSTVHLRRMAQFGPGGTVSSTASDEYAPQPKRVREQPQGLRARFTPIGVPTPQIAKPSPMATRTKNVARPTAHDSSESSDSESESESDSDEEMADAPTSSLPTISSPSKISEAHVANSKLKRKQPGDEQKLQPSPPKEPASSEQTSKRRKSVKPASSAKTASVPASTPSGASKSKVSSSQASKPASVMKETPIAAPNFALLTSSASVPTNTPSKAAPATKSKDKKEKKERKSRKEATTYSPPTEVKRTPIPPPSFPGMK